MQITEDDKKKINQSRKWLLFDKENMWIKKGRDILDVAMGAYNSVDGFFRKNQ